jgi:hypothetical protein
MKIHSIEVDVCAATKASTHTVYKHPIRHTTTRYETKPLGKVAVVAKPGAGSRFTIEFQPDMHINVRQSEYLILRPEQVRGELSPEVRRAFARAGRGQMFWFCVGSVVCFGSVAYGAVFGFATKSSAPAWPPGVGRAAAAICSLLLGCIWVFYTCWLSTRRPLSFLIGGFLASVANNCVYLVRSDLLKKTELAESLDSIYVVESAQIARPMKDYWFRYDETWDNVSNRSWGFIPLHKVLNTAKSFPSSLSSMFGQDVVTFSASGVEIYRKSK